MDEAVVQAPYVAPAPWVEMFQRGQCDGSAALRTFQFLIADEILLPRSAVENADPEALVSANIAFVNSMLNEAMLLPGEFAQEALWGYYAQDYVRQVAQGGHVQYFINRGEDELALRCASSGLKSMIADPHLALYTEFVKLVKVEPRIARKVASKAGYRTVDEAIRDLDRRMGGLESSEPLTPRHATWLRSLRKLNVAEDAELNGHLARIANANPLRQARLREAEHQTLTTADDPQSNAARTLCEQAGLRFGGMRVAGALPTRDVWPEAPKADGFVLRVDTNAGPRAALFFAAGFPFKRYRAVLLEPGARTPLSEHVLNRADYDAIVPTSV